MGERLAGAEKEVKKAESASENLPERSVSDSAYFCSRQVLVEIVRFTQKNGLKGAEGGWKDFLARNDKKFGASVSDPKKRTKDVLLAFLVTFSKDFQKVIL